MGLDIFFSEDIRNALQAADEASSSTARMCAAVGGDQMALRAYLEGYRAALTTVALAFGLSPNIIDCQAGTQVVIPQQEIYRVEGTDERKALLCGVGGPLGQGE